MKLLSIHNEAFRTFGVRRLEIILKNKFHLSSGTIEDVDDRFSTLLHIQLFVYIYSFLMQ